MLADEQEFQPPGLPETEGAVLASGKSKGAWRSSLRVASSRGRAKGEDMKMSLPRCAQRCPTGSWLLPVTNWSRIAADSNSCLIQKIYLAALGHFLTPQGFIRTTAKSWKEEKGEQFFLFLLDTTGSQFSLPREKLETCRSGSTFFSKCPLGFPSLPAAGHNRSCFP